MNLLVFLQTAEPKAGGNYSLFLVMILMFVVMYFFMIRPQQKKQKEMAQFRNSIQKGDKVVTIGGIYGTVVEIKDNILFIEIDHNVKIKVDKSSVVKDTSDIPNR